MTATFQTADQNWQNGTTTYWFDVEGETYGVVEGDESQSRIVNAGGYPLLREVVV